MGLHPWTDTASKCFIVGGGDAFLTNAPNSVHRTTLEFDAYMESKHVSSVAVAFDASGQSRDSAVRMGFASARYDLFLCHAGLPG